MVKEETDDEQDYITIDDDDDATDRKSTNSTNVFSPKQHRRPLNNVPKKQDFQSPINIDMKRKFSLDEEGPFAKQPTLNFITFVNSEDDSNTVDIICRNVAEFSSIADSHGFKLSIDCVNGSHVDVRLTQLEPISRARMVFKEMDELIKVKRAQNDDLDSKFKGITEQLSTYKETIDDLVAQKNESFSEISHVKKSLKEKDIQIQELANRIKNSADPEKAARNRFFRETTMIALKNNVKLMHDLISRLSQSTSSSTTTQQTSPFVGVKTKKEKRQIVMEYLDYLQSSMSDDCSVHHQRMCHRFNDCWTLFAFLPSVNFLEEKKEEWEDKFKLDDDVVGSVHLLEYKDYRSYDCYMAMAIIDAKVVCWSAKLTKDGALRRLYKDLKHNMNWPADYKFVTNLQLTSKLANYFVFSENPDLFKGNKRVVTWMADTFTCLDHKIHGDHDAAIPAIYNMAIMFAEKQ